MRKFFLLILLIYANFALSDDRALSIEADTINSDNNIIDANGNVVVKNDGKKLLTDKLKYDKDKKVIYTESDSKFLIDDNVLFFNNGNVTSDLKSGNFFNGGLKFNNNIFILSDSVEKKEDNLYIANDTTYYICPINEDVGLKYDDVKKNINSSYSCKNIFSVKSKSTKIDGEKKKVYLKNSIVYFLIFRCFICHIFTHQSHF